MARMWGSFLPLQPSGCAGGAVLSAHPPPTWPWEWGTGSRGEVSRQCRTVEVHVHPPRIVSLSKSWPCAGCRAHGRQMPGPRAPGRPGPCLVELTDCLGVGPPKADPEDGGLGEILRLQGETRQP